MTVPPNARLIVGGGLLAGAGVMRSAAAGLYWDVLPAFGLKGNILAISLAGLAVMDTVLALVFFTRS